MGANLTLHEAARQGDVKTCKYLLENGTDTNEKDNRGRTPLIYASNHGFLEIVQMLLVHGADINDKESQNGQTALMYACMKAHSKVYKF